MTLTNGWQRKRNRVRLLAAPQAVAHQAPLFMGFSWQEWVSVPFSRGSSLLQGLNPSLLNCRWILYHLNQQAH